MVQLREQLKLQTVKLEEAEKVRLRSVAAEEALAERFRAAAAADARLEDQRKALASKEQELVAVRRELQQQRGLLSAQQATNVLGLEWISFPQKLHDLVSAAPVVRVTECPWQVDGDIAAAQNAGERGRAREESQAPEQMERSKTVQVLCKSLTPEQPCEAEKNKWPPLKQVPKGAERKALSVVGCRRTAAVTRNLSSADLRRRPVEEV
eukprot:g3822.t1